MSEATPSAIEGLQALAEFRFQLRQFLSFSEAASERCGISAQHYQLMQVVASVPPGERASITYIGERMVLRHNSAVELVDRAERANLVRRETDTTDLRRSLVQLTPHGYELLKRLVAEHMAALKAHTAKIISALDELSQSANLETSTPENEAGI